MKLISNLTKSDIISVLKNGIDVMETQPYLENSDSNLREPNVVTLKFNIFGKMDEIEFLNRIYDLNNMKSYDHRFKNFKGDIIQHRYNNDDWEDFWFFEDDRLELMEDDEHFLNFIKEIFNPYVRIETSNWALFLERINDLLKMDKYELYESGQISGRSIYNYRKIDSFQKQKDKNYDLHIIGEGSYAKVFSFFDDDYNIKFALKRAKDDLNAEEIERFKREFDVMKELNSPYIVNVYKYNDNKNDYIMEYMDASLQKYIEKNNTKLSIKTRINLVNQLLKALSYIHSKGLFHRDLSYNNILLKKYDLSVILKVSDFGLVKISDSSLTKTAESIKGSLHDPNLEIVGYKNYNVKHELYSLMFIIYFIITGKKDISDIKEEQLRIFIHKGLDPDLSKRYNNIEEVQSAFRAYVLSIK